MVKDHYDFCIVGAGPSGLTAAYKLLQGGQKVIVVERDKRVGGLAKSYDYDGQIFDTGPKRFHTDDQIVLDFIEDVTEGNINSIGRSTKVHFLKRYFEWPLQTKDILKMPMNVSMKCFIELIQDRPIRDHSSFHQFIYNKYGETLYKIFFEPYTKKFLRWDPEDIHSDWASTGINRTVIDKRIKSNTLMDLFKTILLPKKIETEFLYPKEQGFGGFFDSLLLRCQEFEGFDLIVHDTIEQLEETGRQFNARTRQGSSLIFDQLIWTGNLNDLCRIINSKGQMHYLNTLFYNVICKEEGVRNNKAQWIYVSQGDTLISRITCMKEFSPYTCKEGYYNFICELTDSQVKPVYFNDPEQYKDKIIQELLDMSFLKDKRAVEDVKINPVVDTYPIYHRRYNRDFGQALGKVKKFSKRIHLLGRCGAFWYNNSDHSIRFAIELTQKLLGIQVSEFDYRTYFGGSLGRAEHSRGV